MGRLACYFPNEEQPRILDSDCHPTTQIWVIGRDRPNPDDYSTQLYFRRDNRLVSRSHAALRFSEEEGTWKLADGNWEKRRESRNGTFTRSFEALKPFEWVDIQEGDRFYFGSRECWILFSYSTHETIEHERDEPTVNETLEEAIAETRESKIDNPWAAIAHIAVKGPEGFPAWLWQYSVLFVASVLGFVAIAWLLGGN